MSTLSKWLVSLLALCAVGWLAPSHTSAAASTVLFGKTSGIWDLPAGVGSLGIAEGALFDQFGDTAFKMQAKLNEVPSPALSVRQGRMKGELFDGSGNAYPRFIVFGDWKATALTGEGKFAATIYYQISPSSFIAPIGKMAGKFADSPSGGIGAYKGEWKIEIP